MKAEWSGKKLNDIRACKWREYMNKKIDIDVRDHPTTKPNNPVWLVVVTTANGTSWFCTVAGDKPTNDNVLQIWLKDRKAFEPYCS